MDSRGRAYYKAAAAAAAADDTDDEEPAELTPKAVTQKKLVEAQRAGLGEADDATAERGLTCPECGKIFLSDKAMYGHMRAHPQRRHKGATRPAATAVDAFVASVKRPRKMVARKEAALDDDHHPGRSPVTGKRGRQASSASSGSAPAPPMLHPILTEEEDAAMTLLDMALGRRRPLELAPMQLAHVADALPAPALHLMPSVEQDAHAVAEHHAPGVQQLDHVAGDDGGQKTWVAEKPVVLVKTGKAGKPAQLEHVKEPLAKEKTKEDVPKEHVSAVTAEPQMPEPKTPVKLGPVAEAVYGNKNDLADTPVVSPGTKKPVKRRLKDIEQPPSAPPPPAEAAADVKPPAVRLRRIPSPASNRKYECTICPKTFPSHQALGGHMANHKRMQRNSVEQQQHDVPAVGQVRHNILAQQRHGVVDAPAVAAAGGGLGEERLVSPPAAPPKLQFQCGRCPMNFPSGQALGGHKRKHFLEDREQDLANAAPVPPMANVAPAPPIASATPPPPMANGATPKTPIGNATPAAPQMGSAAPGQPSRNSFDLNELPKDSEGENQP